MSKGINKDSMSSLLEGLTSTKLASTNNLQTAHPEADILSKSRGKTVSKGSSKERICTSVDTTVMNKIRTISEKEGVPINELIALGLDMVLSRYEETHGQVRPKKSNKGNIDSIFR